MRATGEKYTAARRAVIAERVPVSRPVEPIDRIAVHTTRNGLPLADADCEALTKRGRQCRNPFINGQFWSGGAVEVALKDSPETRMLAQRRCHLHVDHEQPIEVVLIFDDHLPSRFDGPFPGPVWQDPRSLGLIRRAASGRLRADTLAVYLVLTEHLDPSTSAGTAELAGLPLPRVEAALKVLSELQLVRNGDLVG